MTENNYYKEITIIILLYKEKTNLIFQCLENIKNFKIIIVDNAKDIYLKKKIEEKFQIYKYILSKKNSGWSAGVNQAIRQCDTEYILNLQADCLISNKDISILIESHRKYENCFLTSPTYYDEKFKLSYNGGCLPEKNSRMEVLNLEGDVCVESVITAIVLFKKKDILEIGLFDENLFLYFGDFDIARRIITKTKKSIIQIFEAKAQHIHGRVLKNQNEIKRTFVINYNFTFDQLYYFFKVNKHHEIYKKLKKKLPSYIIKSIINLFLLRFNQSVNYFSKVAGFYKFNNFLNKNK